MDNLNFSMADDSVIILGFDRAPAGRQVIQMVPDTGKDWNEDLKRSLGLN